MRTQTTYHHGNVRAELVEAALALTREAGPQALSLRAATRAIGVSPSAAYRHFSDREALLSALARAVQGRMARAMRAQWGDGDGATHLRAVGLGYIRFALQEPGWFGAFFGPDGGRSVLTASQSPAAQRNEPDGPFELLNRALDELCSEGVLTAADREGAEWPCWSAVHGFAELASNGPLQYLPADALWSLAELTVGRVVAATCSARRP